MLPADCRGANPTPGATPGRGALPLRAPRPRLGAGRASSQVTLAAPAATAASLPHTGGRSPRCGGGRGGLLIPPSFSGVGVP